MNQELSKSLAPQVSDKASALIGVPLGIVGVMLLRAHSGLHLTDVEGAAVASVFSTIVGYIGHVIKVLIDRWIEREG